MTKLLQLTAFCILPTLSGCITQSKPIGDFELLKLPVPASQMIPGSRWIEGVGPLTDEDLSLPSSSPGITRLDSSLAASSRKGLDAAIRNWINGNLGFSNKAITSVRARNLSHRYIADITLFERNGAFLASTIEASSFSVEFNESSDEGLELKIKEAESATDGGFSIERAGESSLIVEAGDGVVFAIAVVEAVPFKEAASAVTPLDASSGRRGRPQRAAYGYEVRVLDCDPRQRSLTLEITNGQMPSMGTQRITFKDSESWSPFEGAPRLVGKRMAVRDVLSISWNETEGEFGPALYLDKLEMSIRRLGTQIARAKSGLPILGDWRPKTEGY